MHLPKDLSVLGRLLDDPSPVVRKAIITKLKQSGPSAMVWLEKMTKDKTLRSHARELLNILRTHDDAVLEFLIYIHVPNYDFEKACLLLERIHDPSLPENSYYNHFEPLAELTRLQITERLSLLLKCEVLSYVLFHKEGFQGDLEIYSCPSSSYLSEVLKTRRGIPITLCLIYLFVAKRLGIPVKPVSIPGRFMLGVFRVKEPFYIDCFEGGIIRTKAELKLFLLERFLPSDESFLQPATSTDTLLRCCRNLVSQCESVGDDDSSRRFQQLVEALKK